MRGSSRLTPRRPLETAGTRDRISTPVVTFSPPSPGRAGSKKRVLFVCIGNACRSQMAEAFARAYGADVIIATSAGLNPASMIPALTRQVLSNRGIVIDRQFPKGLEMAMREPLDVVVNMSGMPIQVTGQRILNWHVQDPMGYDEPMFRRVAEHVEELVMRLILELRSAPQ
jgi:arsenate reductase (thioredoxin)